MCLPPEKNNDVVRLVTELVLNRCPAPPPAIRRSLGVGGGEGLFSTSKCGCLCNQTRVLLERLGKHQMQCPLAGHRLDSVSWMISEESLWYLDAREGKERSVEQRLLTRGQQACVFALHQLAIPTLSSQRLTKDCTRQATCAPAEKPMQP